MLRIPALAVVLFLLGAPAFGQSASDDGARTARIQWGPFRLNPTIALGNVGVDTNVFNAADVNHPQSDFTTTLTPGAGAWFRVGRSLVSASIKEDLVYYQHFATERSVNGHYNADVVVPLNRLSFSGGGSYLVTRDRPGFEIDIRSQRTEAGSHGGLKVRAFGKTFLAGTVERSTVRFDQAAVFMNANLNHELSRVVTSGDVIVTHQITPVTNLTFDVGRQTDHFLYSSGRDSSSTRVVGGVQFGTRLGGSASAGYRTFAPSATDVPAYRGLMAKADVSFATVGSTRIGVQVIRDVDYSYDFLQPYYIQTGAMTSFTQELVGPLNGTARIGFERLAYRGRLGLTEAIDRTDLVTLFGGSVGYRTSGGMRVSFNVDRQQRNSDLAGYGYGGLRFGTSVTYGF